jgi:Lon protease-like protein
MISRLPIFPLGSVLFPNMPLKLYIFEERYKAMINACIDNNEPFGVVLIKSGVESMGPLAQPHLIGCTAHISQVQRLPYGRMNIMAVGRDRFRILQLHNDEAYLTADVEFMPYANLSASSQQQRGKKLRPLINRYLRVLEDAGQLQFDSSQIPDDAEALAYLGAVILQTDMAQKQDILEQESLDELLNELIAQYKREVLLLDIMLNPPDEPDDGLPFSRN